MWGDCFEKPKIAKKEKKGDKTDALDRIKRKKRKNEKLAISFFKFCGGSPKTILSYNWKFVPFNPLHPFPHFLPRIPRASDNHQFALCMNEFGLFLNIPHRSEIIQFLSLSDLTYLA